MAWKLALASDARPEIAVVDLLMPRSSGPETMSELRARFPNVRIVAISGLSAGDVQQTAADADTILQKPFTLTDLLRAVGGDAPPGSLTTYPQLVSLVSRQ